MSHVIGSAGVRTLLGVLLCVGVAGAEERRPASEIDSPLDGVLAHAEAHPDGRAAFSFDRAAYAGDLRRLPIGVFDSGIGGLTVLEAILTVDAHDNETLRPVPDGRPDFEHERFVYLADQANMPYGNYPAAGREGFLRELILKDAVFLLGRRYRVRDEPRPRFDKPPVKAIVIACNTATAYGLEDVRTAVAAWKLPIPVIGVVEAGANGVVGPGERRPPSTGTVAVLATVGTCACEAYPKAIARTAGRAGRLMPKVIQRGSLGLAGAIEGDSGFVAGREPQAVPHQGPAVDDTEIARCGLDPAGLLRDDATGVRRINSIENYVRYDVTALVEDYRASGGGRPIETVVLGCTHFPLAEREIADAFTRLRDVEESGARPYRDLVAETIRFVNPAELTARELFRALAAARLRVRDGETGPETDGVFISEANSASPGVVVDGRGGLDRDYKYGRGVGDLTREDVIVVPMRLDALPPAGRGLIERKLPAVAARLPE